MGRGHKTCPKCGTTTGPRAFTCAKCGWVYIFASGKQGAVAGEPKVARVTKAAKAHGERVSWRELLPGQFIKVLAGSGPYWMLKTGVRESMGYYGKFLIKRLDENGIHAYPTDSKNSGHCYIYMGPKKIADSGMRHRPHRIRRIARPKITNLILSRTIWED